MSEAAPNLAVEAEALAGRLTPDRWPLEWSLPYWLRETLRLTTDECLNLVVSNLLGLGFVRLQDDLVDNEAPVAPGALPGHGSARVLLSGTLQYLWINSLRDMFGDEPRFWRWFDSCMSEWQAATWASVSPPHIPFAEYGPDEFLMLAHRGSPLKVSIAGACLLTGQHERTHQIAEAIDDLLTGAVLLDQANDWQEDVSHGRFNVFVSAVLGSSQAGGRVSLSHRSVGAGVLMGDGAGMFFCKAREYLSSAAGKAEQAGLRTLADFACWLEVQAVAADQELKRGVRAAHRAAGAWLREVPAGL